MNWYVDIDVRLIRCIWSTIHSGAESFEGKRIATQSKSGDFEKNNQEFLGKVNGDCKKWQIKQEEEKMEDGCNRPHDTEDKLGKVFDSVAKVSWFDAKREDDLVWTR